MRAGLMLSAPSLTKLVVRLLSYNSNSQFPPPPAVIWCLHSDTLNVLKSSSNINFRSLAETAQKSRVDSSSNIVIIMLLLLLLDCGRWVVLMALVKFCVFVTVNINVIRNNRQVCVCARVLVYCCLVWIVSTLCIVWGTCDMRRNVITTLLENGGCLICACA